MKKIYRPTKKKIINELYEKGKLDVGELRDVNCLTYDILVFMYYKDPGPHYNFGDMVILDYSYGASDYLNRRYEFKEDRVKDIIMNFYEEIYDAIVEKGLIKYNNKKYECE